jgi:small GTP-binding protein
MILAKICVLGEVAVGKTSLVRRFVDRTFSETYLTTVGVTISRKRLFVPAPSEEGVVDVQLVFWDLEGGQNFRTISSAYRKGAHGAIIVGDVTRQETIEAIPGHIEQFLQTNPASVVAVALNKTDLLYSVARTPARGWTYGQETVSSQYTSAKTGEGVDELITDLGTRVLLGMKNGPSR